MRSLATCPCVTTASSIFFTLDHDHVWQQSVYHTSEKTKTASLCHLTSRRKTGGGYSVQYCGDLRVIQIPESTSKSIFSYGQVKTTFIISSVSFQYPDCGCLCPQTSLSGFLLFPINTGETLSEFEAWRTATTQTDIDHKYVYSRLSWFQGSRIRQHIYVKCIYQHYLRNEMF